MDQEFVMISRGEIEMLLLQFKRAEGICDKARSPSRRPTQEELMMEPTCFYSGASGYARATLRNAIQILELKL